MPKNVTKICAFCGGSGKASKEHLWPEWSHDLLPNGSQKEEFVRLGKNFVFNEKNPKIWNRPGSPKTFRPRVVCERCNNGWMSELESQAQPIIREIIVLPHSKITQISSNIISQWLFVKFIVCMLYSQNVPCVDEESRFRFCKTREIPRHFHAYISHHEDEFWRCAVRGSSHQLSSPTFQPIEGGVHNINTFSLGFSKLFFFSTFMWATDFSISLNFEKFSEIFPLGCDEIYLPASKIDKSEIWRVTNALSSAINPYIQAKTTSANSKLSTSSRSFAYWRFPIKNDF